MLVELALEKGQQDASRFLCTLAAILLLTMATHKLLESFSKAPGNTTSLWLGSRDDDPLGDENEYHRQ